MAPRLINFFAIMVLSITGIYAQSLPVSVLKGMKVRSVGPAVMGGRITAVDVVVDNPDIIYVGAASGGVWKSMNGGISWIPVFDKQANINIGAIKIQQSNPNVIWVGTGEGNPRNSVNMGNGIYKSVDGGLSWTFMGLEKSYNIHRIIIDPVNPDVVYAGVIGYPFGEHEERGLFKSVDGGNSWEKILYTNEKSGVAEMVIDPSNPNKLLVAMWEHRRTPWDFSSGGPGSGLFLTYNGGKDWVALSEKHGLPKGSIGRIGLAYSRSVPNKVYALVEATKNGLYRSDDGGEHWLLVSDDPAVATDRPFYYNEIYVDPLNESKLYKLGAPLTVSEDGGKSFVPLATSDQVHSDHHAFFIHPTNPNFIVEGNDGGLAISRDHGRSWSNPEAIPLGQFYHVNVDNEIPYNIYGGLQDNGSWTGPAYTFEESGIRNYHWQAILLSDGFDVVPDPVEARYGYAMSQGGNIVRYDKLTGGSYFVKPTVSDPEVRLRFNWNTALAQDPFDVNVIYAGSQFVHKSIDKGMSWETISPDLTLNDPEHHKQEESGGLTLDATNAENHNTIIAIAPSTLQKDLLWIGTDDGHVHLSKDGGGQWEDVGKNITGFPHEAWVAQITASKHHPGEAFVVANLYRMGLDMAPYIYRTTDFGRSWTRLADENRMKGYALCFLQDPVEPSLMFAGTEHGLWVSIDEGKNWAQWDHGIPAATPTMDLAIQEREADLVVGTFGRSIYVLDDIRPLRELASSKSKILEKPLVAFNPADAYLGIYRGKQGYGKEAEGIYKAEDRMRGANLTYYIKSFHQEQDSLIVKIIDEQEQLIRLLRYRPDTGVNRINWDLTETAVAQPEIPGARRRGNPTGPLVFPGKYKLVYEYGNLADSTFLQVLPDPRTPFNKEAALARRELQRQVDKDTELVSIANQRIQEAFRSTELIINQLNGNSKNQDAITLARSAKATQDSLNVLSELLLGKRSTKQGIGRPYSLTPMSKIQEASSYISRRTEMPTKTEKELVEQAAALRVAVTNKINQFFGGSWKEFRNKVHASSFLEIIKEYPPL